MNDKVVWYGRCLFIVGIVLFGLTQIALAMDIHDPTLFTGAMIAYYASIIFFIVGLITILTDLFQSQNE
ncbi:MULTISPECIES: hypothetical protein [Shouchella]|uniref:Uncharacterized protein n=4 Tax=Bacillaceae TaxID=186817 RepID=A0A060LTI5_9BACI|nr:MULTISPECIES: hypothetical protein [Bacillaceae]RQW22863.1 hypothetical protein EH196_03370 [Bacillus sp. C1-1]AIC93310.1 hypothetical protein BleG1_0702 [Shouchella lehensis G1]KQL56810.1 hypothetical protein AN965_11945 [Alkalicoccobacillus plakortidis]MBG9782931.1 hypothetical protein [Shouchella lehensis]MED4129662.1 hypothetical protein [Shouchella miscanthi]